MSRRTQCQIVATLAQLGDLCLLGCGPLDRDHLPFCLTTHATTATTTMTSKIGTHIPPYPSIQPPPHMPPFIMFSFCAKEAPVTNRATSLNRYSYLRPRIKNLRNPCR
jgi:hypothetical protein